MSDYLSVEKRQKMRDGILPINRTVRFALSVDDQLALLDHADAMDAMGIEDKEHHDWHHGNDDMAHALLAEAEAAEKDAMLKENTALRKRIADEKKSYEWVNDQLHMRDEDVSALKATGDAMEDFCRGNGMKLMADNWRKACGEEE